MINDPAANLRRGIVSIGRVSAMPEIWEHGRLTKALEGPERTWHNYSTFPDTVEWSAEYDRSEGDFTDALDRLGRAGWQMVQVVMMHDTGDFYFKRLRPE